MSKEKSLFLDEGSLRIETPLGIVNIRVDLRDSRGRRFNSVEVLPNQYFDEPKVVRRGPTNIRLIELKKIYR